MFMCGHLETEGNYIIRTPLINVFHAQLQVNHSSQTNWIMLD